MTFEQYEEERKALYSLLARQEGKLTRDYCDSNNPYKVGDKFTDHNGTIIVTQIGYYYSRTNPCCIYTGIELKKDGTPKKNNPERNAYQCNEVKP